MKPQKKPRSDSPLRMLPEERQADIIEMMKTQSAADVRKELKADGMTVSTGALSDFFSWWHLRQQFQQNESDVQTLINLLRRDEPEMGEEKIFAMGQRLFSVLAMKSQSAEDWERIQKTRQKEEQLKIERQKFRRETCKLFIEWVQDEEAKRLATSTASNAEKIEALGRKMFGEDWE